MELSIKKGGKYQSIPSKLLDSTGKVSDLGLQKHEGAGFSRRICVSDSQEEAHFFLPGGNRYSEPFQNMAPSRSQGCVRSECGLEGSLRFTRINLLGVSNEES